MDNIEYVHPENHHEDQDHLRHVIRHVSNYLMGKVSHNALSAARLRSENSGHASDSSETRLRTYQTFQFPNPKYAAVFLWLHPNLSMSSHMANMRACAMRCGRECRCRSFTEMPQAPAQARSIWLGVGWLTYQSSAAYSSGCRVEPVEMKSESSPPDPHGLRHLRTSRGRCIYSIRPPGDGLTNGCLPTQTPPAASG